MTRILNVWVFGCTGAATTASAEILVTTDVCLKAFGEEGHAPLGVSLLVNYDLPAKRVS